MLLTLISFIVVMSVLVFVHEFGHFIVAKRNHIIVDEFGFGFPPRVATLGERNGTVYTLNAIPFGGFVRMRGEDDPSEAGSFAAASKLARTAVLLAGPVMNFLLAIVLFAVLTGLSGIPDPNTPGAVVTTVAPGSPAAQAGLQVGDRIVAAEGAAITGPTDLQSDTAARLGKPVDYTVLRAAGSGAPETLHLTMTPRANPPQGQGALGIGITVALKGANPAEALWQGATTVGRVIYLTFQIPANLIREGKPISDAGFMGPVGIAVTTGEVVREAVGVSSIQPILWFMGLLSTALGVTNLLPIPGLDGGRWMFVILEAIRRRRIEPAQEGMVHLIGFGLLLVLVGFLTVHEISALVSGTFPTVSFR